MWVACAGLGLVIGFGIAVARRYGARLVDRLLAIRSRSSAARRSWCRSSCSTMAGPYIGLELNNIPAGMLALSIYASAYYSELWRAGFEAVPKGHIEAADCVGLTPGADDGADHPAGDDR